MPPDKPLKLFPEPVRTFLEIGLKYIIDEQGLGHNKERKKSLMFKFVRMLCVSNSYLYSRRKNPDIYRLNLGFTRFPDKYWISFSSKCYVFSKDDSVCLTHDYARKLINLLLPPYIGAYFLYDKNKYYIKRQSEILNLTKGKIGISLNERSNVEFFQKVLKTFADRIHELRCPINFLLGDQGLQFSNLDYLFVDSLDSFDQFAYVLKHEVKQLEFGSILQRFAIEDENAADLKNETIKKLTLPFVRVDYDKFEELLEYFYNSCLDLKHLDVKTNFSHYEFPANQISNQVVAYVRLTNTLKTRFGNSLISMFINFSVQIYVEKNSKTAWIEKVRKSSELSDWHVKLDGRTFGGDKLKLTYDNAGCKLEISIAVFG